MYKKTVTSNKIQVVTVNVSHTGINTSANKISKCICSSIKEIKNKQIQYNTL